MPRSEVNLQLFCKVALYNSEFYNQILISEKNEGAFFDSYYTTFDIWYDTSDPIYAWELTLNEKYCYVSKSTAGDSRFRIEN